MLNEIRSITSKILSCTAINIFLQNRRISIPILVLFWGFMCGGIFRSDAHATAPTIHIREPCRLWKRFVRNHRSSALSIFALHLPSSLPEYVEQGAYSNAFPSPCISMERSSGSSSPDDILDFFLSLLLLKKQIPLEIR